jgi:hypothetical protein
VRFISNRTSSSASSSPATDINPRVRSVAITHALLTGGGGPLYITGQADRLRDTLLTARSAL